MAILVLKISSSCSSLRFVPLLFYIYLYIIARILFHFVLFHFIRVCILGIIQGHNEDWWSDVAHLMSIVYTSKWIGYNVYPLLYVHVLLGSVILPYIFTVTICKIKIYSLRAPFICNDIYMFVYICTYIHVYTQVFVSRTASRHFDCSEQ